MNKNVPAYLTTRPGPVAVARCTECGVLTLQPTRPFLDRGGVFSDGCGDCPPANPPPTTPPPGVVDDDGLGPIFIVTGNGVIRAWPKDDETKSDDDVVFIAR